jgi:hypothetical protein
MNVGKGVRHGEPEGTTFLGAKEVQGRCFVSNHRPVYHLHDVKRSVVHRVIGAQGDH